MRVQRYRSVGRVVRAFAQARGRGFLRGGFHQCVAALFLVLATLSVATPIHAGQAASGGLVPSSALAPFSTNLATKAANASHLSDAAKNDGVIDISHQIEAIRRMPLLLPARVLMRSNTTHIGIGAKINENTAVSVVKRPLVARLASQPQAGHAHVATRAPPLLHL
ncbi:MAG: hypothetical protein ACOH12_10425 [Parvibaculaceae bacterium]